MSQVAWTSATCEATSAWIPWKGGHGVVVVHNKSGSGSISLEYRDPVLGQTELVPGFTPFTGTGDHIGHFDSPEGEVRVLFQTGTGVTDAVAIA